MYLESRGLKIVVADSDRAVLEMLQIRLDLAGHETHVARTATAAVEMVRSLRPAVLIIDLQLQVSTGMEVLENLNRRYRRLPMPAMLTGRQLGEAEIRKAAPMGVRDCMVKPYSGADVIDRVARLLKKFPADWETGTTMNIPPARASHSGVVHI
ncbi:MAG TPA: response regulator [Caulobacter sp.]|nr:response regulator [Caulobacter sp.]